MREKAFNCITVRRTHVTRLKVNDGLERSTNNVNDFDIEIEKEPHDEAMHCSHYVFPVSILKCRKAFRERQNHHNNPIRD